MDSKLVLDELCLPAFYAGSGKMQIKLAAVTPSQIDARIMVQQSRFTIHTDRTPLETLTDAEVLLQKFIIPGSAKEGIMRSIELFGIKESQLFPDLEHWTQDTLRNLGE